MPRRRRFFRSWAIGCCALAVMPCSAPSLTATEVKVEVTDAGDDIALPRLPQVVDVALDTQGGLRGRVIDAEGKPQAGVEVKIEHVDGSVAQARSDQQGDFQVENLRGGAYHMATTNTHGLYRLWTHDAAPPKAEPMAILQPPSAVRGQCEEPGLKPIDYLALTAIVAAAVAVPIAVHNARLTSDQPSASP